MTTLSILNQAYEVRKAILERFKSTGEELNSPNKFFGENYSFASDKYRRAHISIIDKFEERKLWLLHCTVFPHTDDSSPIYGFDIIAGPTKVSGAFHDFSPGGDSEHSMMKWFEKKTADLEWNKKRELPDWGKQIFSNNIVAIGAVGPDELEAFIKLGLESLDYYLRYVGKNREENVSHNIAQNRYCYNQRENPHTPRVLENLGYEPALVQQFIAEELFPNIA
jgi:hypothetical protein